MPVTGVQDISGTLIALALVLVIALAVGQSSWQRTTRRLIYVALALRLAGACARYLVLFVAYDGSGDARVYYAGGLSRAQALWSLDFGWLTDSANWVNGTWWGTNFVYYPSALVHAIIGPGMPGGFIVFSLLAFIGLGGFVYAFQRTNPSVPASRYARWIWLLPALWFWPSSIGKEAIVLLGLGCALAGYSGREGRSNWLLVCFGTFLVFGIRPQVAAVLIFALVTAHAVPMLTERWTLRRTMAAVLMLAAGAGGLYYAFRFAAVESFDLEGIQSYMEGSKGRSLAGGSTIEAVPVGLVGIPLALLNVLFRPFLWEAQHPLAAVSSLEMLFVWAVLFARWRNVLQALRNWHRNKLLRVALPFLLVYAVSLGMVVSNLGVIARQRIFLLPFLFLLVEAAPRAGGRSAAGLQRARAEPPGASRPAATAIHTAG